MHKLSFYRKEMKEYFKTPKGMILLILFVFFAISSPLLAKYINEILLSVAADIAINLPAPRMEDSWLQFYKNFSTICLIVYLIVMTGSISQEKTKGSIELVLTKNVSRLNFISSKFLAGSTIFTFCFAVSVIICGWYTNILFGEFVYDGLFISLVMFWLMGLFFTALAIFVSIIGKTPTTSALLGFCGYALLQILNISTDISMFNPSGASSLVNGVVLGSVNVDDLWIQLIAVLSAIVVLFVSSFYIFKKQEI